MTELTLIIATTTKSPSLEIQDMSVIDEKDVLEIVETVWMTVLELPIDISYDSSLSMAESLGAEIKITGAWTGTVAVKASRVFLEYAASVMFSCLQSEVNDSDCADTLTELTNMLGGTVKCLLPEICDLSLPSITSETIAEDDVNWIVFSCMDNLVSVCVSDSADVCQEAA